MVLCVWSEGFLCLCNNSATSDSACHSATNAQNETIKRNIEQHLCFSKPDGTGHIFRLPLGGCDENSILRRKQLLRTAGIHELSPKARTEVLTRADEVAVAAKTNAIATNGHGNTITERDVQAEYDRARQEYIEVHDKFSFYTETVQNKSKVDGKSPVLKFARYLPICSCHVRTEDVTELTRENTQGVKETRYSLKDDAIIYTAKQIWNDHQTKVIPISALESPRDRGSGYTPAAAFYKQEYIEEMLLHEQTLIAMNELYSENLTLAAHIDYLNDQIRAQETALAYEKAQTAEAKKELELKLASLCESMNEGSLKFLTLTGFLR